MATNPYITATWQAGSSASINVTFSEALSMYNKMVASDPGNSVEIAKPTPSVRLLKEGEMPKKPPKYPGLAKFMADHKVRVEAFSVTGKTTHGMAHTAARVGVIVDGKRMYTIIRPWTVKECPTENLFDLMNNYGAGVVGKSLSTQLASVKVL